MALPEYDKQNKVCGKTQGVERWMEMGTRGDGWINQNGGRENKERGLEYVDI